LFINLTSLLAMNLSKPKKFLNTRRNQAQFLKFRKPTKTDFRKQITENRLQTTDNKKTNQKTQT
jgi:hypothetical protein